MVVAILPLGIIGVVGGAAAVRPAARLRRHPRHPRAARHDRQERGHPDRADRGRTGPTGCGLRDAVVAAGNSPLPADDADRAVHRARHDADRAHRLLGADGLRHHGRAAGGDAADPGLPADALRHLVRRPPRQPAPAEPRPRRAASRRGEAGCHRSAAARRGAAFPRPLAAARRGTGPAPRAGLRPAGGGAGAWASLRLLPPALGPRDAAWAGARPRLACRCGARSRRASTSRAARSTRAAPIRPGTFPVPLACRAGLARDGFRRVASLQPGTLPAGARAQGRNAGPCA